MKRILGLWPGLLGLTVIIRQQGVFGEYHLETGRASTLALDVTTKQCNS